MPITPFNPAPEPPPRVDWFVVAVILLIALIVVVTRFLPHR